MRQSIDVEGYLEACVVGVSLDVVCLIGIDVAVNDRSQMIMLGPSLSPRDGVAAKGLTTRSCSPTELVPCSGVVGGVVEAGTALVGRWPETDP